MKLIKETSRQRYYQLDFKITKGNRGNISDILTNDNDPINFEEPWEMGEDLNKGIDKICVSDARTHCERLVFPAFNVRNKETGEIMVAHRNNQIAGCWTMKIHGGDANTMRPDEVYVRYLKRLNNKSKEQ